MSDISRGDHGLTFQLFPGVNVNEGIAAPTKKNFAAEASDQPIIQIEQEAIASRRKRIKGAAQSGSQNTDPNPRSRDREKCAITGLALSGGGIRSAAFSLGVMQGLHAAIGIEGIDYLSTVSGGGYAGCALTAAMQSTAGEFPFIGADAYADSGSVRHIRDYSNYLIPRGGTDVITAIGIIARGLIANAMIIAPLLFVSAWFTLLVYPTKALLGHPVPVLQPNLSFLDPLWQLHGFWLSILILGVDMLFLAVWVFAKSVAVSQMFGATSGIAKAGKSPELQDGFARFSKILFFLTAIVAFCELQPSILYYTLNTSASAGSCNGSIASFGQCVGTLFHSWIAKVTPVLAPFAAIVAFFNKNLADVVAAAKRSGGWTAWMKALLAKLAIVVAGLVIPSLLWLLYYRLASLGLNYEGSSSTISWLGSWASWSGTNVIGSVYFEIACITAVLALFINPNATSLHRLYRDRLSKAFLFNPAQRDKHGDLDAVDIKLHGINTDLCPYPIVNAALNIQGSKFVNKRGRNADFFTFTPDFTGSDATGYIGTQRIEKDEAALDLGTAMAISGAAVSANMGIDTIRPLSLTLALLNFRLGYWLRNPRTVVKERPLLDRIFDVRSFLLFKEMFSLIDEATPKIYLTDGGNIENLGVYSLLKRKCPVIIAVDAEADPTMSFGSFLLLERYARIDLGVVIDLPWQAIRDRTLALDEAFADASDGQKPMALPAGVGPHCAVGTIHYGPVDEGVLLYIKASLTGDESDYIFDYKRRNPDFPHETTGDQFFGEEQLEAYRALGFHCAYNLFTTDAPLAARTLPTETDVAARQRMLAKLRAAVRGS